MQRHNLSFIFFILILVLPSLRASAQSSGTAGLDEISLHAGQLLPSQIKGMTEILPIVGVRYGLGVSFGTIELDGTNAHAKGVDWTCISISVRGDTPLFDGGNAIYYGGLDSTFYQPVGETSRSNQFGLHVGGGLMLRMSSSFWFRPEAKLMNNPGSTLYVGAGITYQGL
jgi:hypothetical protein